MTAPKKIIELVERFEENRAAYTSGVYNETQLRREFIDPFFKELGWDIDNQSGFAEAYKDVIHEDAIKVGAPDYCFRIGGTRKFFVEAKKPSVDLKEDVHPAFQLRRYAWSSKLPLSILTDFEEFVVYDCRVKPSKIDKASIARIKYYTYKDYLEKWDEIAGIFSRDAVLKGAFDKYVGSAKGRRGTAEVDQAFLAEIQSWREDLAKNIALLNSSLTNRELNYVVQRTIDRIIFLRICEDRGIEDYGMLLGLINGNYIYARLLEIFERADQRYNSGIFHFHPEKDRHEPPDELSSKIKIDDKVLKGIFKNLYYPESSYEFSVLPAEILGQVYEQFLGQVIHLTDGHHAVIEVKPEVKKAGGVYYTPAYIVDYIVKNTVGKIVEGKTPRQVSKLKILDPACGSGSFLIGAYQFLLDWHLGWYLNDKDEKWSKGKRPVIYQHGENDWRLTVEEKKRILLNNIHGVDIDSQAVEVTKLSLLLKVLERENGEALSKQYRLFHERVLPDLGDNIKCGNSLIGPDIYSGAQSELFGAEERLRVNAFDWQREFSEIMSVGGFDAVIGNPPYGAYFSDAEKDYIKRNYKAYQYKFDSYVYFIEKVLNLVKVGGYVSFITPELWLKLENSALLRKLISQKAGFDLLQVCGENVFINAVVNTVIFRLQCGMRADAIWVESKEGSWLLPTKQWEKANGLVVDYRVRPEASSLITKIKSIGKSTLADYGEAIQGITPYDKYRGQAESLIKQRGYHYKNKHDDTCGKWLSGKDVSRYVLTWSGEWLSYGPWLAAPREPRFFNGPRLLFREVPGTGKRIQATLVDQETLYHGHSITPFKLNSNANIDLKYLLGLVNSKLLSWYGGLTLPNFGKNIFPKLNPEDIKVLPIRPIKSSDSADLIHHEHMVTKVESILSLNQQLIAARTDQEKTALLRQIDATDAEIDRLVYKLYGLTEEEIRIVEGSSETV